MKVIMEFRKGILFVRLSGSFNDDNIKTFNNEVKEVITEAGIKYVVLNLSNLKEISKNAIKEIKKLRKTIIKTKGDFYLFGGNIKGLKKLVHLENELKVFEKVVI